MKCIQTMIVLFLAGSAFSGFAADDFFSPIDVDLEEQSQPDESEISLSYKGFVIQKFKYGLREPLPAFGFERDEAGLSQVQTDWFHEWRGEFSPNVTWQLSGKAEADWLRWNNGETEWETNHEKLFLKDAFVDAVFDNGVWVRAGHQVFSWRQSESFLAITDVLSPVDLREPGQAELQDIREQVPAVMVSVPVFDSKFSTVVTYEAGHNRYADEDEEFYPYRELAQMGVNIEAREPDKPWELAIKLDHYFNGGDISAVAADINDNELAFQRLNQDFTRAIFTQERVRMVGVSTNRVRGSWLFQAEVGKFWDQPVANTEGLPWQEFDQIRSMIGVEYNGWDNWLVNVELSNIYLSNYDPPAENSGVDVDESQPGYLVMVRNTAMNDRLENQLWLMDIIGSEGKIYRWETSYDLSDRWKVAAALVLYEAKAQESTFYPFQNHDSMNFSVEYYY